MTDRTPCWLQITTCPECHAPAEVLDRYVLASTDGPVEHARVRCVQRHVLNLPVGMLAPTDRTVGDGRRCSGSVETDGATHDNTDGCRHDRSIDRRTRRDPRTRIRTGT